MQETIIRWRVRSKIRSSKWNEQGIVYRIYIGENRIHGSLNSRPSSTTLTSRLAISQLSRHTPSGRMVKSAALKRVRLHESQHLPINDRP